MIYVLACPKFETDISQSIARFRERNEPERAQLVAPHITLVFGLKHVNEKPFLASCENVADKFPEFDVDFPDQEIVHDPFEQAFKLFLNVGKGASSLGEMHRSLYKGAHRSEVNATHAFRPHMTVATHKALSVIEGLNMSDISTSRIFGTISAIDVVKLESGRLTQLQKIPLAKKNVVSGN